MKNKPVKPNPASNPKTVMQKVTQIGEYQPIISDLCGRKWDQLQK
jgi:hypothetical protein